MLALYRDGQQAAALAAYQAARAVLAASWARSRGRRCRHCTSRS